MCWHLLPLPAKSIRFMEMRRPDNLSALRARRLKSNETSVDVQVTRIGRGLNGAVLGGFGESDQTR